MRINFTFRNLDSSDGIKSYASDKVAKLQKYMRSPISADVTISTERHLHRVDVSLNADGLHLTAHNESEDMYASIDLAVDKLDRQVRDAKQEATDRKRNSHH